MKGISGIAEEAIDTIPNPRLWAASLNGQFAQNLVPYFGGIHIKTIYLEIRCMHLEKKLEKQQIG